MLMFRFLWSLACLQILSSVFMELYHILDHFQGCFTQSQRMTSSVGGCAGKLYTIENILN